MTKFKDPSLILAVLISVLIFMALSLGTTFPILADDYYWLNFPLSNPHFKPTDLYIFSRMPVSGLFSYLSLKSGIWENFPKTGLVAFFTAHALAFSLLLRGALKEANFSHLRAPLAFILVCSLFALQPNNYEIHLWHLLSTHALGALLIALSFAYKGDSLFPIFGILGITAGLLTYDTFIFLFGGAIGISLILSRKLDRPLFKKKFKSFILIGFICLSLTVLIKIGLGRLTGFLQVPPLEHSPSKILDNLKSVFKIMGLVHFYKVNWVLSLSEWVAIGLLVFAILRNRYLPRSQVFFLLALPFVIATPLSLNTYSAQRAFYGPQLIKSLVLAFLLYVLISSSPKKRKKLWVAVCALFAITYLVQWEMIMKVKRRNYAALENEQQNLVVKMALCVSPCTFQVPPPGEGVKGDYVVPEFVWRAYYQRVHLKNFPEKKIQFDIQNGEKAQ